jgi:hypothetical protein
VKLVIRAPWFRGRAMRHCNPSATTPAAQAASISLRARAADGSSAKPVGPHELWPMPAPRSSSASPSAGCRAASASQRIRRPTAALV